MNFFSAAIIGVFFGFAFGVGCALAVMHSIYMGGYRRAVADSLCDPPPPRYLEHREKLRRRSLDKPKPR